ncbi:MAG: hypothetical protein ABFC67_05275 [Mizugakiibacter sp.]|uniref:hypothetical protein n=1 Tax=Mizugakiibacter sp. TaxID=1972610 RepID=UPI00320E2550
MSDAASLGLFASLVFGVIALPGLDMALVLFPQFLRPGKGALAAQAAKALTGLTPGQSRALRR